MTREERHTLPPERDITRPAARAIRVSVMDGIDAGQSVVVYPDMRIHVGTEELSDLRVVDRTVSARHLAIDCVGHRFRITDLDSANGTRLNGVRVADAYIIVGDRISCGNVTLAISAEGADEDAPLSRIGQFGQFGQVSGSRPPPDIKDLLAEWQAWAQVSSKGHRKAALRLERRHYWLGIPSTLMGAIVGTTIFGTIERAASSWPLKIGLAFVSMTAAGLVALQTFLRYLERAGQHNLAHAEYEDIARSIELLSVDTKSRPDWVKSLEGLGHRLDAIKGKAPILADAEDLEHEMGELKQRFRMRLSAAVARREHSADAHSVDALASPPRLRRALPVPPTDYFNGPLEPTRFHEEDERIAAWREANERARLGAERRTREAVHTRSRSRQEREGGSFAAQLRAFEAVDS